MKQHDIFLYHLDNELQKLFSLKRYDKKQIELTFNLITKIGFLLCKDALYIPASNYFESDLAFNILNSLKEFGKIGALKLVSSSFNLQDFLDKKIMQYNDGSIINFNHYYDFYSPEKEIILPGQMKKRNRSASNDIKNSWYRSIREQAFVENLYNFSTATASKFEDALFEMPQKLGAKAYISDHIIPLLPIAKEKSTKANHTINAFITKEYINSFLNEYNAACLKNLLIIDDSLFLQGIDESRLISYTDILILLRKKKYQGNNLLYYIEKCTAEELVDFKYSYYGQILLQEIFSCDRSNWLIKSEVIIRKENKKMKEKIFIVHGHDNDAKEQMARVLEKLGFDVIILHEQANGSLTIIEKIEKYADVKYAVILYTECDLGRDKNSPESAEKYRARQNVVFEHGYLIGRLSRQNVCAFVKGSVETPGDISGVVYIQMDDKGGWKIDLCKNLRAAGLSADMNQLS